MQKYIHRPDRHAFGRENSTDPEPGSVRLAYDAQNRDIVINIPDGSPINRDYVLSVLRAMIEGLQGSNNNGGNNDGSNNSADSKNYEYDVFISHSSLDKKDVVNELVECLRNLGVKVWVDTTNVSWGSALRGSMDEGLKKARYGIVILSPNYIAEDRYWTKAEMDALFQLESAAGKKILLPVWHRLTKEEVLAFSPLIASRNALNTANMSVAEIAIQVAKVIRTEQ